MCQRLHKPRGKRCSALHAVNTEKTNNSTFKNNLTFKRQNKKQSNWSKKKRELCSHCLFLNKELGSTLKTDHPSHLCGKKNVSVSLVESLGLADSNSDTPGENLSEYEGGIKKIVPNKMLRKLLLVSSILFAFGSDAKADITHRMTSSII